MVLTVIVEESSSYVNFYLEVVHSVQTNIHKSELIRVEVVDN